MNPIVQNVPEIVYKHLLVIVQMELMTINKLQIVHYVLPNVINVVLGLIIVQYVLQEEFKFLLVNVMMELMMLPVNVNLVLFNVKLVIMNMNVLPVHQTESNNHYVVAQKELMITVMLHVLVVKANVNPVPNLVLIVFFVMKITQDHQNVKVSQKHKNQLKLKKEL